MTSLASESALDGMETSSHSMVAKTLNGQAQAVHILTSRRIWTLFGMTVIQVPT